ncbi:hypothetical protein [Actinophytocola sp. KF-1]
MTELDDTARRLAPAVAGIVPDEQVAQLRVRELLRGLAIAAAMSGVLLPLSRELGDVWLALLERPGLWREVAPDAPELVDVRVVPSGEPAALCVEWLACYLDRFGPLTADVVDYWPAARYLADRGVDPTAVVA